MSANERTNDAIERFENEFDDAFDAIDANATTTNARSITIDDYEIASNDVYERETTRARTRYDDAIAIANARRDDRRATIARERESNERVVIRAYANRAYARA